MSRIPYFDPKRASNRVKIALSGKRKINVFRMIANSENCAPEVFELGYKLSKGSSLEPQHREVAILRVAHAIGAEYLWQEHTAIAQRVGLSAEKIDSIAAFPNQSGAETLDAFDVALLTFTDELIESSYVRDEAFGAIRQAYDESHLVELILLVGFYTMVGRVTKTLHVDLQAGDPGSFSLTLD